MYTVLRIDDGGVRLLERHARRLGVRAGALADWSRGVEPGVYRVTWDGDALASERRPASRLVEGMPTRVVVSPFAGTTGRFPKPAPPSPYDAVRVPGVATLLSSADGVELYESCAASLVSWDGARLVLAPVEAPGVASVAEAAVAEALPHVRARLLVQGDAPLMLINAVAGCVAVDVPGRRAFPRDVRDEVERVLR